jgi:hypothetical protein
MKFDRESLKLIGVLRLRGRFGARSRHSAQDDKVQVSTQFLPSGRTL